jgi:hypothetical protein
MVMDKRIPQTNEALFDKLETTFVAYAKGEANGADWEDLYQNMWLKVYKMVHDGGLDQLYRGQPFFAQTPSYIAYRVIGLIRNGSLDVSLQQKRYEDLHTPTEYANLKYDFEDTFVFEGGSEGRSLAQQFAQASRGKVNPYDLMGMVERLSPLDYRAACLYLQEGTIRQAVKVGTGDQAPNREKKAFRVRVVKIRDKIKALANVG